MTGRICALTSIALLLAVAPAAAQDEEESDRDFARNGLYLGAGGNYAIQLFTGNSRPFSGGNAVQGTTDVSTAQNTPGFNLRLGGRVHPHAAVEAMFEWHDTFDITRTFGDPNDPRNLDGDGKAGRSFTLRGDIEYGFFVNAKGYLMKGFVQPYVLGGIGGVHGSQEQLIILCNVARNPRVPRDSGEPCLDDQAEFDPFGNTGTELSKVEHNTITSFAGRLGAGIDLYATPHILINAEAAYVIPTGSFKRLNYLSITGGIAYRF